MPSRLDSCARLYFLEGQDWCPFPAWAHFFIRTGWELQRASVFSERLVIAVCLPQRGFAACFAALGALLAEPLPRPTPDDIKRHFTHLLTLPDPEQNPTALTYLLAGRKLRGSFAGAVTRGTQRFVKVCVQTKSAYRSGGLTYYVQEGDAINLQIEPGVQPRLGRQIKGRTLVPHTSFVNHFYSQDELHLLHLAARCQVLIVGRINALREETTQVPCAVPTPHNQMNGGVLNDILRIRKFLSESSPARIALYPTQRGTGPSPEDQNASRLVIFDGADAFTKWCVLFPNANMLVILDRTEALFQEGLSQLNARYYLRSGEYPWHSNIQMPPGVEAISFLEVRR